MVQEYFHGPFLEDLGSEHEWETSELDAGQISVKRLSYNSSAFFLAVCIIDNGNGKGGRGGSGGSRGGSSRGSSSRTSWGSSSSSGRSTSSSGSSGSWSSGSKSGSSRWGSARPSGSLSRWSGGYRSSSSYSRASSSGTGGSYRSPSSSPNWSWRSSWRSSRRAGAPSSKITSGGPSSWGSSVPVSNRKTGMNAAGNAAIKSAGNRPSVRVAPSSVYHSVPPVQRGNNIVVYRDYYPGATTRLLIANNRGYVDGYLLGTMMARSRYRDSYGCCYGCGCYYRGVAPPWYYQSYVPQRYYYAGHSGSWADSSLPASPPVHSASDFVSACILQRWNMELPFTEFPNMVLRFLASDEISGNYTSDKAKFFQEVIQEAVDSYGTLPAESNVFEIPSSTDLWQCNFALTESRLRQFIASTTTTTVSTTSTTTPEPTTTSHLQHYEELRRNTFRDICKAMDYMSERWETCKEYFDSIRTTTASPTRAGPVYEEPVAAGLARIKDLYNYNLAHPSEDSLFKDLIGSARRCYANASTPTENLTACLDFSLDASQALQLTTQTSLFGNPVICAQYLNIDVERCVQAANASSLNCSIEDMVNIIVFVRNYYLCSETLEPSMIWKMEELQPTEPPVPLITSPMALDGASSVYNSASCFGYYGAGRLCLLGLILALLFTCG